MKLPLNEQRPGSVHGWWNVTDKTFVDRNQMPGNSLRALRWIWVIEILIVLGVWAAAIPARFQELLADSYGFGPALAGMGSSIQFFSAYATGLDAAVMLAFILIGALVFWRNHNDRLAILFSLVLILMPVILIPLSPAIYKIHPAWRIPILLVRSIAGIVTINLFYVFPNGRFVPGWTRWLAVISLAFGMIMILPGIDPPADFADLRRPLDYVLIATLLAWLGSGAAAQIFRYRYVSSQVEKQQTKWVVLGFAGVFLSFVIVFFPLLFLPSLHSSGNSRLVYFLWLIPTTLISLFFIPLSITVSILRYRLWDIDFLLRRTLVYTILTTILAVVYFGGVILLQMAFRLFWQEPSQAAIVISTLTIAFLFTPLRRRIHAAIDRHFYRRQYSVERTMNAFSSSLRNEVDVDQLTEQIIIVVNETMQPVHVTLWLKKSA
jgi:hypothetical protein